MKAITETVELRNVLRLGFIIVLSAFILYYLIYQARFLIMGPIITLSSEFDPVYNERIIAVSGSVKNSTSLTLNGRVVYTDEHGQFSVPLVLENGYTIMSLRAEDRYGRETAIERSFVYRPASSINL